MKDEKTVEPDFDRNCIVGKEYPIWYKDQKFVFEVGITDRIGYFKPKTKLLKEEKYIGWFGRHKTRMVDVGSGWRYHEAAKTVKPDVKAISFKDVWITLKDQLEYAFKTHVVDNRAFIIDCSPELEKFR